MGKTVKQLLSELDSKEISEWVVMDNLPHWEKVIEEKRISELDNSTKSDLLARTLFGRTKADNG